MSTGEEAAEVEVQDLIGRLVQAWNRRDTTAVFAMFTADADYVTTDGEWLHGPQDIAGLLRDAPTGGLAAIHGIPSVRATEDMATVVCRSVTSDGSVEFRCVTTCVVVKRNDQWLIDRLQNTEERAQE